MLGISMSFIEKNLFQKMNKNNKKLKPFPEVGKEYHFWDDWKTSPSRHYICRCERIVKTIKEAKTIKVTLMEYTKFLEKSTYTEYEISLYDIWKKEVKTHDWLFAEDTDAFIEISCPKYDENNLWAVRTKNGGWFTMDIQSSWQGGTIDVTGEVFESVVQNAYDDGYWELGEEYKNQTY